MLNSEKIFTRSNSLKDTTFNARDYVETLIRHTELIKAENSISSAKKTIEDSHAGIDAMTCDELTVIEILKNDAGKFLDGRAEVLTLRNELENLPVKMEEVTALHQTDYVHIVLMAHACYAAVLLPEKFFDPENDGINLSEPIKNYYAKMTVNSKLKDSMKNMFAKIFAEDGNYFYAIRPKKSDFDKEDIAHFLARFSAGAKRTCKENKKTKEITFSTFQYRTKTEKKNQCKAFTEFLAVVLDNNEKHIVCKPEEVAEPSKSENK